MKSLALLAILLTPLLSWATPMPILTGLWEVTTSLDEKALQDSMKDLPDDARAMLMEAMGGGEMKANDCVNEADLKEGFIPEEEGCVSKEVSKTKTKWIYEMSCKDPVSSSRIELTFNADKKSYSTLIASELTDETGAKQKMTITQNAKWLKASCDE
jgi:hypothetical protein